jgi:hypothetical protein
MLESLVSWCRDVYQRSVAASGRPDRRGRRVAALTAAVSVASIGGAAALAVTLPDPAHAAPSGRTAARAHGTRQRPGGPAAVPSHAAATPHATSGAT